MGKYAASECIDYYSIRVSEEALRSTASQFIRRVIKLIGASAGT